MFCQSNADHVSNFGGYSADEIQLMDGGGMLVQMYPGMTIKVVWVCRHGGVSRCHDIGGPDVCKYGHMNADMTLG